MHALLRCLWSTALLVMIAGCSSSSGNSSGPADDPDGTDLTADLDDASGNPTEDVRSDGSDGAVDGSTDAPQDGAADGVDARADGPTTDLSDGGAPGVSGELGPDGGEIRVTGDGPIAWLEVSLPEGVLGEGETVDVTLSLAEPGEAEGEALEGAFNLGPFTIEVGPVELYERVTLAWEVNIALAVDRADLPDPYRAVIESAPDDWMTDHLVFGELLANPFVTDSLQWGADGWCGEDASPSRARHDLRTPRNIEIDPDSPGRESVVITVPGHEHELDPVRRLEVRKRVLERRVLIDTTVTIEHVTYFILTPRHSWNHTPRGDNSHIGPVVFEYYPVAVYAEDREHAPIVLPDDGGVTLGRVITCYAEILDTLDAILDESDFRPIESFYPNGDPHPVHVLIYDYETDPFTLATADSTRRLVYLPTGILQVALEATGDGSNCVAEAAELQFLGDASLALQIASIVHEFFHIQQGVYFVPQQPDLYRLALEAFAPVIAQPVPLQVGEAATTAISKWSSDLWFTEATARFFERTLFPSFGQDRAPFAALSAYPLYGPAFNVFGGQAIDASSWHNYNRWFFFKFLFDQEAREPGAEVPRYDELRALAGLLEYMGGSITRREFLPYSQLLANWLREHSDLDWFDFFREFTLLRGCGAVGECDDIDPALRHAFARGQADSPDFFGFYGSGEDALWSTWDEGGTDLFGYRDQRYDPIPEWLGWGSPRDSGRTVVHRLCAFETTRESYFVDPSDTGPGESGVQGSSLLAEDESGGRTLDLSRLLQGPQGGMRIDFFDDVARSSVEGHTWAFEFGGPDRICPDELRYELWSLDRDRIGEAPVHRTGGVLSGGRSFTLEMDPGSADRVHTLLVGNDTWDLGSGGTLEWPNFEASLCTVRVAVVPHRTRCGPCASFPTTTSDAVKTAFCLWYDEGGGEHRDELCHDGGPDAPGGLYPILFRPEFQECWDNHSELFTVTCDMNRARFESILDDYCEAGEETLCTCCPGDPVTCDPWPEPPFLCE